MRILAAICAAALIAGCGQFRASPEPAGSARLAEGPCFGTCPVYDMTLNVDDSYRLDAGRFTRSPGISSGVRPEGSFAAAVDAFRAAGFDTLDIDYTPDTPSNCPQQVTDLPTVEITRDDEAGAKTVRYYFGCLGFLEKERLDALVAALRDAIGYGDLVAPPR